MVDRRERGYPVPGTAPESVEDRIDRGLRESRYRADRRWRTRATADALWFLARFWCAVSLVVALVLGWVAVWRLIQGAVYGAATALGTAWLVVFCAMWLLAAVDLFTAWLTDERRWR